MELSELWVCSCGAQNTGDVFYGVCWKCHTSWEDEPAKVESPAMEELDINKRFYTVILEGNGRMYPCKHQHLTPEDAHACVREGDGLSIIEWIRDRDPQFSQFWIKPGLVFKS